MNGQPRSSGPGPDGLSVRSLTYKEKGDAIMNMTFVKSAVRKPIVLGLAMLTLGLMIGGAAERLARKEPVTTQSAQSFTPAQPSKQNGPARVAAEAFENWDPFQEMRALQTEMDELFGRSLSPLPRDPWRNFFPDDAGFPTALEVRELKDRFEVRANLPDAQTSDANVKLEGNRLEVEVTHRKAEKAPGITGPPTVTESGRYRQTVELAGNLKSDQMKVEHKNHELRITIPKA